MTLRQQTSVAVIAVAVWACVCFLPGLGRVSLFDRDEPRFAEAARQMMVRGNYVVPFFNGEPRLHKPPLIYWVMVAGYKTFGVGELGARVGSAVAGILTCVLVFALARRMFGLFPGVLSGIILATNILYLIVARAAIADSVQLFILLVCFHGLWRIYREDRRWSSYVMLYGGIALGGLIKGPVVPCVVLLASLLVALLDRRWTLIRGLHLLPGLLAATAVVALWFVPANLQTGGAFWREGVGHHVLERAFSKSMEGHRGPFFYYVLLLPATFFPWIAALPMALRRLWVEAEVRPARTFLLAWAIAPFLLFSFLKTKLPHYILPAYPALAIAVAFGLDEAIRNRRAVWDHWTGKLGFVLFAVVGLAAAVAAVIFPFLMKLPGLKLPFIGAAILILVVLWFTWRDLTRHRTRIFVVDLAIGTTLAMTLASLVLLPALDRVSAARILRGPTASVLQQGRKLLSLGYREPTLVFYTRGRVTFPGDWGDVANRVSEGRDFVCMATKKKMKEIPGQLRENLRVTGHVSAFLPSKGRWDTWTFLEPEASKKETNQENPARSPAL